MGRSYLGLAALLALAPQAEAFASGGPPDTQPGAAQVFLICAVTEAGLSRNCRFYTWVSDPTARLLAGSELGYIDAHPVQITGARPGAEVKVLVRLMVNPGPDGKGFAIGAPEGSAPAPAGSEIKHPAWVASPHGPWTDALTAELARRQDQEGEATARCTATQAGTLADCWVEKENPPNFGFGEAALIMLQHARMKPVSADGAPVAGRGYVQTFRFSAGSDYIPMAPILPSGSMGTPMGMGMPR
jgi:hypothetical protein